MIARFILFAAAILVSAAHAAVDVNLASEAELDGIKGIGPPISRLIIAEREKSHFKNWDDFIARVKGAGPKSAARFSAEGLTVADMPYKPDARSDAKQVRPNKGTAAGQPAAKTIDQ